jgi:hypothetical protein
LNFARRRESSSAAFCSSSIFASSVSALASPRQVLLRELGIDALA